MSRRRSIWVGTFNPAPDNPPRKTTVQGVFSTEAKAIEWVDAYNLHPNRYRGSYRHYERFELDSAAIPRKELS